MSKKDKRRIKPVYVVMYQLKDAYGVLPCIEGVYEDPDDAWRARQKLNTDQVYPSVAVSILQKKEIIK